jgi:AcrR family transcriptional regulator
MFNFVRARMGLLAHSSSSSHRVERKRQQRRERILEAAVAAVAESGPADFSLNQLARDLDYTPGALYWYFPSKDALVAAVQRVTMEELAAWIEAARAAWEAAPHLDGASREGRALSTLLRMASYYLRLEKTAPKHARIIAFSLDPRLWLGDEEVQTLMPVMTALFRPTASAFQVAEACGALIPGGPTAVRSIQYWTALQGALYASKLGRLNPELFHPWKLGMNTAETLLRGWGAAPEALDEARGLLDRGEATEEDSPATLASGG